MNEFKGVVENITHSIVVGGKTYTTPVYDVEYTCYFNDKGEFHYLMCNKHKGINTIPHLDEDGWIFTGEDFDKIINEAYPDKELMHLVCEKFFRQYDESDAWGTPRVLYMCGFKIQYLGVYKGTFKQLLSKYDYYYIIDGDPILKLTHDCSDKLIERCGYFIKKKTTMKEFTGIVKNITHSIVVGGVTYTTPTYNVEYTCCFDDEGTFNHLICDEHKGVEIIPHKYTGGEMCTGQEFIGIIDEAYPNKELIHLICERFFMQYNEEDELGTLTVLEMCGFVVYDTCVNEGNFEQLLSEYDYYYVFDGDPILKLTPDCKNELTGEYAYFIKRKQQ